MERNVTLNNGVEMPIVGLGTWNLPKENMLSILKTAFDNGYRKIDTAWKYHNETEIGKAIRTLGLKRDELFITTKLYIDDLFFSYHPRFHIAIRSKSVKKAYYDACKRLKTDYIDLYLVHWPFLNYYPMIWAELVKLYQKGDIRAIGVSSFNEKHFVEIEKITDIVPAVNQIEVSPYNTQKDLITFTKSKGIQVEGYSAFNGMYNASDSLFNNPVLKEFANKKCKTIAQIINRWQIQQDITIIPRSKSAYHQRENIDIFDFELSVQEMKKIDQLNQNKFVWGNPKFDYYK